MARVAVVRYESHAIRDVLAGRQELTGAATLLLTGKCNAKERV